MTFDDLARAYPVDNSPCKGTGEDIFTHQCAIRMSTCFISAGISLDSFPGAFCWHKHGRTHILRAQEMADWLDSSNRPSNFGPTRKFKNILPAGLPGSGVVCIIDFWQRTNQSFRNRSGDHMDLYDMSAAELKSGSLDYFNDAKEVWYWPVI